MSPKSSMDELARDICRLSRRKCIDELTHFKGMRLDFDRSFLEGMSTEKLRHTLMAAFITAKKKH